MPALKTLPRVDLAKSNGTSEYFPKGLSQERYIIIKIYDTSAGDPNKTLAQAASIIPENAKKAFGEVNAIENDGSLNITGTATTFLTSTTGDLYQIATGDTTAKIFGDVKGAISNYTKDWEGVGNPALNSIKEVWKDNIYLPLPNELTESLSHDYGETTSLLDDTPLIGAAARGAAGAITKASNYLSKLTGTQALKYNENKLIQFNASEFRTITLNWTLIPNKEDESLAIQTIITKLKAYSSPQAVSGKLLLRAPFFCRLEFPNKVLHDALQFKECVMTNIEVNYSTTGYMETFKDHMPKTMSLSITFKDREPKTLQAWADGNPEYNKSLANVNTTPTTKE